MSLDYVDRFEFHGVKDHDLAGGRWYVCAVRRGVRRWCKGRFGRFPRQWVCQVAILGGRGKGTNRHRVGRCLYCVEEFHVLDIVEVHLVLQNDHQPLSVQPHGQYRCGEGELAYYGVALGILDL